MERRIERMNWREVKKAVEKIDRVILPMGTLEAHSITSNNTDTIIPEEIAINIAEKLNALILPAIPYGVTTSLLPYPGSVNIKESVLSEMILDIARSCKKDGYKSMIIINGHGGNNSAVDFVKKQIFLETGMFVYIVHWWIFAYPVCKEVFKADGGHGSVDETAMVLSIDENLVKQEYINDDSLYFQVIDGISSIPSPASTILYSDNGGKINPNKKLCREYHDKVISRLGDSLLEMLEKTEKNLL
jgi:creatinine amidohydrolase